MWAVTGCSAVSNGADGSTVSDWNEGGGGGGGRAYQLYPRALLQASDPF